jgi:hypothetical protein
MFNDVFVSVYANGFTIHDVFLYVRFTNLGLSEIGDITSLLILGR